MIQYRGKGALAAREFLFQNVIDDQGVMQRRGPSWKSSTGRVLEIVCDYKTRWLLCDCDRWPNARSYTPYKSFPEFLLQFDGENFSWQTRCATVDF